MRDDVLTEAFADELEKLAFDPLAALPAIGTVATGIWAAANPKRFDPAWVNPKWAGGTGPQARLMSGLLGAGTAAGLMSLPSVLAAPFRHKEDEDKRLVHTAGVELAAARGGRNIAKSSKIRELFKPRSEAVKAFRDNLKGSQR